MWNFSEDMARWDELARESHTRHSRERNSAYVRSQSIVEAVAHRYIARLAAGHKRVLELGVGGGEHLAFAPHLDQHELYVGADISPVFAEICRDKFGIPVATADVAALPFSDNSFDCAIAISLLEHVQDLEKAFSEVERVLAPGGRFYVVVPTNGSFAIHFFKMVMTYPTMRARGIQRPDLVWHYLNANPFKRIRALLYRHFDVVEERGVPISWLPWHLSPMWAFSFVKR